MKRFLGIALPVLLVAAAVVWWAGRAPTRHALERACLRYHAERLLEERRLGRADAAVAYAAFLRAHRTLLVRGWEVRLVPTGADPPEPEDFVVAASFDPSGASDPLALRGPVEVWLRPRGALARLLAGLGASP